MSQSTVSESSSERIGTGLREIASFAGRDRERMLSVLHLPTERARAGVTIAPSLLTDRIRTYRAEIETARSLAREGIAVHRFDYRGFGQSDEYPASSESMVDDMKLAVSMLESELDRVPMISMGVGWGALIAATQDGSDGLVMWEPPTSGKAYLRAARRANKIALMGSAGPDAEQQVETEILGFDISERFRSSAESLDLSDVEPPPRALWVTTGDKLPTAGDRIVDGWKASGSEVELATLGTNESWWFIQAGAIRGGGLFDTTASWIECVVSK
ncbi:MAG TPA: alpha/beta hydrolase [Acidimicrobiia bacterium]|nr:alpha/beta hydrolase [Acidimicrobiia bacterium]